METTNKQHQQDPHQHVASPFVFDDVGADNLLNGDTIKRVLIVTDQSDQQSHIQSTSPFQQPYTTQDQYLSQQPFEQTNQARPYLTEDNKYQIEIEHHHQHHHHHQQQQQNQYHQQQQDALTNGHDQFYNDCQQQFLPQQHYNNNQDKHYTDLDEQQQRLHQQQQQHQNDNHRVRFVNSCESSSSPSQQQHQFQQQNTMHQAPSAPNQATSPTQHILHPNNHQQQQNIVNGAITNNIDNNTSNSNNDNRTTRPYVEIVEQPARCALRFRYKCEGRSAGSLPGSSSTIDNKTFPSIRINNYRGRAVVVISTVTRDEPYKAHPHNIVGREGCKKGICTIVIQQNEPNSVRSFPSLGIQCVKRRDIEESLGLRESIHVDPFREGFEHKHNSSSIDLNAVRLCFQVFIEGSKPGKCDVPLMPIVSSPIHDKKAMSDLVITKLSHCSAPATGGREVILLCDRITKEDIKIRFFEERQGRVHWEAFYEPTAADIHKQVAICFKTPKYLNENIQAPVMVRIQLKRISDNQVSESRPFQFLPCESDEDIIHRKRQKIDWVNPERYALK